jgi:hypothetical protein
MNATVAERVAKGVKWLDANAPGWDLNIDLNRFDLGSGCGCVLGQTFGRYEGAPLFIGEDCPWPLGKRDHVAVANGFFADPFSDDDSDGSDDWADLEDEWWRVIKARQAVTP